MFGRILNDKRGSTAVVFALAAPVVLGGLVLVVEAGHWQQNRTKLQNIADMAAIAAARELVITNKQDEANIAAIGDAAANGFDFSNGTVNASAPTGKYISNSGVTVVVNQKQDLFFSQYFMKGKSINYTIEATALITGAGEAVCVVTLGEDPDEQYKGLIVSGSSSVTMDSCSIYTNVNTPQSIDIGGRGYLEAGCINTAGDVEGDTSDYKLTDEGCSTPNTYEDPISDPYDHLSMPSEATGSCLSPDTSLKGTINFTTPGRYCDWYNVGNGGEIKFSTPGNYVFDGAMGAGISFKSSSAKMTGSEVTLFFMNDSTMSLSGASVDLSAPTSGTYKGILFYGDPVTNTRDEWMTVEANATSKLEGVIYFPTWNLKYAGGATINSECTSLVVNSVTFIGNSEMTASGCTKFGVGSIGTGDGVAIFQ